MSRAFVKEDDAGEPPIIPARAALPPGIPNYVTPAGLVALRTELEELETKRAAIESNREDEANRTRQLTIIKSQINALSERLNSAKVVDPKNQPPGEVRFGATVTLVTKQGAKIGFTRTFTIVGVDEASITEGKIGFVAPIAKAVLGAKVGETVPVKLGREEELVEVKAVTYA